MVFLNWRIHVPIVINDRRCIQPNRCPEPNMFVSTRTVFMIQCCFLLFLRSSLGATGLPNRFLPRFIGIFGGLSSFWGPIPRPLNTNSLVVILFCFLLSSTCARFEPSPLFGHVFWLCFWLCFSSNYKIFSSLIAFGSWLTHVHCCSP